MVKTLLAVTKSHFHVVPRSFSVLGFTDFKVIICYYCYFGTVSLDFDSVAIILRYPLPKTLCVGVRVVQQFLKVKSDRITSYAYIISSTTKQQINGLSPAFIGIVTYVMHIFFGWGCRMVVV